MKTIMAFFLLSYFLTLSFTVNSMFLTDPKEDIASFEEMNKDLLKGKITKKQCLSDLKFFKEDFKYSNQDFDELVEEKGYYKNKEASSELVRWNVLWCIIKQLEKVVKVLKTESDVGSVYNENKKIIQHLRGYVNK